jgi:N-acyl-L-homoserine lactone synthetase
MNVRVKHAQTAEECDQLFQLRHTVFVEQDHYLAPRPDQRIFDRFDALPSSRNMVALVAGNVIGGARYTCASNAGTPAQEYFDFEPYLPPDKRAWGCGSMLCLHQKYRGTPVAQALLNFGYLEARLRSWSHMIMVANPKVEALFRRQGWRPVSSTLFDKVHQVGFVAMLLELSQIRESARRFASSLTELDYSFDFFDVAPAQGQQSPAAPVLNA